jgi:hypothetical protein
LERKVRKELVLLNLWQTAQPEEDIMTQYVGNVLKYDRVSGRKSGLRRLKMLFDAAPGVQSGKNVDEADCNEKTKTWEEDMKEKIGGWWW